MPGLTEEQRAFWDEIGFSLPPEDASPEKWKQFVSGMRNVFVFDGYDAPSEEALRAEVERRGKSEAEGGGLPDGGYIDLPFESGSADPQHIQYEDLGPDKKYTPP